MARAKKWRLPRMNASTALRLKALVRPWPIYLLMVAVVAGTFYFNSRRPEGSHDSVLPATLQLKQDIEVQFQDVIMEGRQKGLKHWLISAPTVSLSKDGRYTYFEPNPQGAFLNLKDWNHPQPTASEPNAAPTPIASPRSLKWQGDKAQFDSYTNSLAIDGDVVITTDASDIIKTAHLDYDANQQLVTMPKPVDIHMADGTTLKGDSLSANSSAEVLELKGKVDLVTRAKGGSKL